MNKTVITIIVIVALAFLIYSFTKGSKANANTFAGTLVSAKPKPGFTNTYYNIATASTIQTYYLTFTPIDFVAGKTIPAHLPQSKQISTVSYKAFVAKYPDGLAEGNVLDQYN